MNKIDISALIKLALEEDLATGDVTSEAIFSGQEQTVARIIAKEKGVFCGEDILKQVYAAIDSKIKIDLLKHDGELVEKGDLVAKLTGSTKSILEGERTALNFIQRMSGIATKSQRISSLLAGGRIKLLDTRKTLPGFRLLDKYAVKMGGAENHRIGLYDMVMIKDNHIKAAGSITTAVEKVRSLHQNKYKIEVETTNLDEVKEALASQADIIMLDNMSIALMEEASVLIGQKALIEISGNVTEETVADLRDLAVDFVSMGALTHSVKAFDLSMKFD